MEFSLFTTEGGDSPEMFRGDAAYSFNDSGLLTIVNEGKRRVYAPGAWNRIEDTIPEGERTVTVFR